MTVVELFSIYNQIVKSSDCSSSSSNPWNLYWGEGKSRKISSLANDTRQLQEGGVYFAIRGTSQDGHDFLPQACEKKPLALVVEKKERIPSSFKGTILQVPQTREVMDLLASRYYANPSEKLFCIGVTGTNGKTSTTYMLECIFNALGKSTAVMGTVNHHLKDKVFETSMTTPGAIDLQSRLRDFVDMGSDTLAMEVSSHALDQKRAASVSFDLAIFTNLTRDHLDYHKTMEKYFKAKQKLFLESLENSNKKKVFAILNFDDEASHNLLVSSRAKKIFYGIKGGDFKAEIKSLDFAKTQCALQTPLGVKEMILPMGGVHNVSNALGALAAAYAAGLDLDLSLKALSQFSGVPGRLQFVDNNKGINVFVDYAHTPDALENVLKSLTKVREENIREENIRAEKKSSSKLICVFGCGGDRDQGKRSLMGEVAAGLSDVAVVTSDNPRTENPQMIIDEILKGCRRDKGACIEVEVDRAKAIFLALSRAQKGDVVLIAGKGHEDYQIIGTEKKHFSDFEVVKEYFHGS